MPRDRDQRPTRQAPGHLLWLWPSPGLWCGSGGQKVVVTSSLPLLCGSRALGQCLSILLGMLPGSKVLSTLKEGDDVERPPLLWLTTGQSPCLSSCLDPEQSHQPGSTTARACTLHAKEPATDGGKAVTRGRGKATGTSTNGFQCFPLAMPRPCSKPKSYKGL